MLKRIRRLAYAYLPARARQGGGFPTLRLAIVLALLLPASAPVVAAGEPEPCLVEDGIFGFPPCADGLILRAVRGHASNATANATAIVDALTDQPGVVLVDLAENEVCRGGENPHCRLMDGRPLFAGILSVCERNAHHHAGIGLLIWTTGQTADATMDTATTLVFAGTPLEGERLCEEHWSTLRAYATLP